MEDLLENVSKLLTSYRILKIEDSINWEKYNLYSITHHSTSIEGASLSEIETELLLEENITAKGRPMVHHLMQQDHYKALLFVLESARNKRDVTPIFLKEVAALVMKSTGGIHHTALGSFDSSNGDLRLLNVYAGSTRFVDYSKIPGLVDNFCRELNDKLHRLKNFEDALITSFDAHFNLVSIHPWADGNGRVSRLLMNFVQYMHYIPLSNIYKEDKADYYKALIDTRKNKNSDIFRMFMLHQYIKMLEKEIARANESMKAHSIKNSNKSDQGMSMIF